MDMDASTFVTNFKIFSRTDRQKTRENINALSLGDIKIICINKTHNASACFMQNIIKPSFVSLYISIL